MTTAAGLGRAIDAATTARARLHHPVGDVCAALEAAARRWAADPALPGALAATAGLPPAMMQEAVAIAAGAFDARAMGDLAARELRDAPPAPPLVAHVLASNVPALALPAIAHGLLVGAAVVVKSGRADPVSAPAFRTALTAVDPDLAATIVTETWPGGTRDLDDVLLDRAPVVVLTGGDEAIAALAARARGRVIAHGTRSSLALVDDVTQLDADALARDVAFCEQRGCLSPQAVYVRGDAAHAARLLAGALEAIARRWPPAPGDVAGRASLRQTIDEAEWTGAAVTRGLWGAVLLEPTGPFRPTGGGRTVRVHALDRLGGLPALLPAGRVECVGTTGPVPDGLQALGVSRVCRLGDMQRPTLAWPRGGRPPLRSLVDAGAPSVFEDGR